MSDLEKLLREEAEHAEQNKDATPSSDAKIGRPGRDRAKVLSVRLNAKEYEQLTAQAELAGVGPSTLARSMILLVNTWLGYPYIMLLCMGLQKSISHELYEASALGCNVVASENCGNAALCDDALRVREFSPAEFVERTRSALATKQEDRITPFLDEKPYRDFLETLDVL